MAWNLKDKVAIVGIGHSRYTRPGASGRTALSLALEAAINACVPSKLRDPRFARVPSGAVAPQRGPPPFLITLLVPCRTGH